MTIRINVTAGEKEYAAITVTEKNGASLEAATFAVGLSASNATPPTTWQTPDVTEVDGPVATLKLLVDNVAQIGTVYLWAKLTDVPELLLVCATNERLQIV